METSVSAAPKIAIDRDLVEKYILELATMGAYGETGVWRIVYSPEWVAATGGTPPILVAACV